jgi:hypothetical protein
MNIDEQIKHALAEGKRIKANARNLWWFVLCAAQWVISADLRTIAFAIVQDSNQGTATETLCYRCYDLAARVANDEHGTYIASRALEVIYQVRGLPASSL